MRMLHKITIKKTSYTVGGDGVVLASDSQGVLCSCDVISVSAAEASADLEFRVRAGTHLDGIGPKDHIIWKDVYYSISSVMPDAYPPNYITFRASTAK